MKHATRRFWLSVMLVISLLGTALVVPAVSAENHVETVVEFDADAGELPEGVTVDPVGNVFVSLSPLGQLVKVRPGTNIAEPFGAVSGIESGDFGLIGLAPDAAGNVYGGVQSANPAAHGVWKFDGETGAAERVAGSDRIALPNGIAVDDGGTLYITDTILGAVWRVVPGGAAELWIDDSLLDGTGAAGFPFPIGANGIAVQSSTVYVGVTETSSIVTIPIQPDGSAGQAQLYHQLASGFVDGIALDARGNVYVADPISSMVVRVNTDRSVETLATAADGLDAPSSLAFGAGPGGQKSLYVVNFSVALAPPGGAGPALLRMTVAGAEDGYEVLPYAWGLENPRGLSFDADGQLVATLVGSGDGHRDGRIVRFRELDGNQVASGGEIKDLVNGLPTSDFFAGVFGDAKFGPSDAHVTADGEVYFVTNGFIHDFGRTGWGALWSTAAPSIWGDGLQVASPYAHVWPYELANNPDGGILESNPYALVLDEAGNAYVSDAASNAVFKVAPDGMISTYAVFDALPNPTDVGPLSMHVAPTGIVWGPDGALYVGSETGFPWPEGSSPVWRLEDLDGDGDVLEEGEVTQFATGLTTVTDIAFDTEGRLLATEFRYILTGEPINSGRVLRWEDGAWTVLADGLTTPTGVAVAADGTIYVSMEYAGQIVQLRP